MVESPRSGWWLDNEVVTFYHGTHKRNKDGILKDGIFAPKEGSTANWISLALDPYTAFGYAAMSASGGETAFRKAGGKPVHTPPADRIVFKIQIPQKDFLKKIAPARGNMDAQRDSLKDKSLYDKHKGLDFQYYQMTEIRYPKHINPKFITGYTFKK